MQDDEKLALRNDFARSLRDMADRDYIAARVMYRFNLGPQFLWSAQQALEKYLKALLLYNGVSSKGMGHDLRQARGRIGSIKDIRFDLPDHVWIFIARINEQGDNRYSDRPAVAQGDELLLLDRTVWFIRRYCRWMRGTRNTSEGPVDRLPRLLSDINLFEEKDACQFRIYGGFLEQVLERRKRLPYDALVWKNFYYGKRRKRIIRRFTKHSWSINPAHYRAPERFKELNGLVYFPDSVKDAFKSTGGV